MLPFIAVTVSLGLAGGLIFLFFLRRGQFDEIEDAKYDMFRDEK